jgi:ArsR family transcriptional regulator
MDLAPDFPADALDAFSDAGSDAPARAARFLKSLAHRDRLKLLCVLIDGELPVAQIEARVGASQSAVSQHLARLRAEGVVSARRDGRQVLYAIEDPIVLGLITLLYDRFCATGAA